MALLVASWAVSAAAGGVARSAAATGAAAPAPQGTSIRFEDVSAAAGITAVTWSGGPGKDHILESAGNGVVAADLDVDGHADLYFVSAYRFREGDGELVRERQPNALYRNLGGGRFAEVATRARVAAAVYGSGGCLGDYDGDGLPDLYVTAFGDNLLYRNNGDGTFSEVAARAGVAHAGWSTGAAFLDADGDGDQDLYVANYIVTDWERVAAARRVRMWRGKVPVLDGPRGLQAAPDAFYRNGGDGTFREAGAAIGLAAGPPRYGFGVLTFDADGDGLVDVYVANDSQENHLYHNLGGGRFQEIGTPAGAAYNADGQAQGSMGVDAGDTDGDGRLDLAVTNFAQDYYTLYRNVGGPASPGGGADGGPGTGTGLPEAPGATEPAFEDRSFDAGIAVPTFTQLGWGTLFLDADRDGDQDLFFANGHLYVQVDDEPSLHESYRQLDQLFRNDGGRFVELEAGAGLAVRLSSRGAAAVDLDDDGDVDIAVSNQDAAPTVLDNRSDTPNGWIGFRLLDRHGDRLALGTRVTLHAGGRRQVREVRSGGSYMSQSDLRLHFGLGASAIDRIEVRWPDGTVEVREGLEPGRYHLLVRE